MEQFLNNIIDNLKVHRVTYGDIRIVEQESESIVVKNGVVEAITHSTSIGFGVRVLKDSAWGFSSSNIMEKHEADTVTKNALNIAQASARVKLGNVSLAAVSTQRGTYRTNIEIDPLSVPLNDKIELLLACDSIMQKEKKIKVRSAFFRCSKTKTLFASTDDSLISQERVITGGGLNVYALHSGELQSRSYSDYGQSGYEFISALDFKSNAARITDEVVMLLKAKPCPEMKTTVILDAHQMVLQVHESCGHPAELDRVLGTEASYAGTSFLTLEKLNNFVYGSDKVNIVADATIPGGLGTFGWDDEGVPGQRVYLVKEGRFVGYLTSRETACTIKMQSSGAMRADGWNRIPLIRMTNINLEPGNQKLEDIIAETQDGVFMSTNKSWSIDDKRLNFQFGCEFARGIKNGKFTQVYKNPTYAGITPQFWKSCDAIADKDSWHLSGVHNCGKGEPGQIAVVGHGTAPTRFKNVQIGIVR
jgi:TldD protein